MNLDDQPGNACSGCGALVNPDASHCRKCRAKIGRGGHGQQATRCPSPEQISQRAAALRRAHLAAKRPAAKPKEKRVEPGGIRLFVVRRWWVEALTA